MIDAKQLDLIADALLERDGAVRRYGKIRFPCPDCGAAVASYDPAAGTWGCEACSATGKADDLIVALEDDQNADDVVRPDRGEPVVVDRPLVYFADGVARQLGVTEGTARRWMACGKLGRTFKVGKRRAIRPATLRATLAAWEQEDDLQ